MSNEPFKFQKISFASISFINSDNFWSLKDKTKIARYTLASAILRCLHFKLCYFCNDRSSSRPTFALMEYRGERSYWVHSSSRACFAKDESLHKLVNKLPFFATSRSNRGNARQKSNATIRLRNNSLRIIMEECLYSALINISQCRSFSPTNECKNNGRMQYFQLNFDKLSKLILNIFLEKLSVVMSSRHHRASVYSCGFISSPGIPIAQEFTTFM